MNQKEWINKKRFSPDKNKEVYPLRPLCTRNEETKDLFKILVAIKILCIQTEFALYNDLENIGRLYTIKSGVYDRCTSVREIGTKRLK